ncbi:putative dual adapter for phosphotyrosine and 3-phosphotyrosine and 3-phosphoinositide [Paratrimastix pyriformis]|uniref:Dual adapter for phosphotyrosine and 3-phosphotyrosine and 3-phosphoinositide n=1 Tax=Paratrimastix pyriformis TaxID=342808 RepID=A0ABQ8UCJ1_9EUKA|nr:putative dual adapter for phosphotyrosine and 3-phosphotyrosine and 3-phosphoinositide [Paratrimastix pyriformis]
MTGEAGCLWGCAGDARKGDLMPYGHAVGGYFGGRAQFFELEQAPGRRPMGNTTEGFLDCSHSLGVSSTPKTCSRQISRGRMQPRRVLLAIPAAPSSRDARGRKNSRYSLQLRQGCPLELGQCLVSDTTGEEAAIGMSAEQPRRVRLQAQFDFQARVPNELSFKEGEIIDLIEKHESGMWKGELRGRVGLFPYNFVQEMNEDEVEQQQAPAEESKQPVQVGPKEGYLTKQGHIRKNWKKRWFVLRDKTLSYYAKKNDAKPAGQINIAGSEIKSGEEATGKNYCFHITFPGSNKEKEYFICAENGLEMNGWVTAINAAKNS